METGSRKYSRQMGQEASLGSSAVGLSAAMGPLIRAARLRPLSFSSQQGKGVSLPAAPRVGRTRAEPGWEEGERATAKSPPGCIPQGGPHSQNSWYPRSQGFPGTHNLTGRKDGGREPCQALGRGVRPTSWKGVVGHGSKEDLERGLGVGKTRKSIHGKGEAEEGSGRRLCITGRVKKEERSQKWGGGGAPTRSGRRVPGWGRGSCPPLGSKSTLAAGTGPASVLAFAANSAQSVCVLGEKAKKKGEVGNSTASSSLQSREICSHLPPHLCQILLPSLQLQALNLSHLPHCKSGPIPKSRFFQCCTSPGADGCQHPRGPISSTKGAGCPSQEQPHPPPSSLLGRSSFHPAGKVLPAPGGALKLFSI